MMLNPSRSSAIIGWLAFLIGFSLPISTPIDNIAAGALLLVWGFSGDWALRWQRLRSNPATYAVAAMLVVAAIGMTWSLGSAKETLRYFGKYAALILTLCLLSLPLNGALRQRTLFGFVLAIIVVVVISFGFKFGVLPPSWFPGKTPDNPVVFKLHITHGFFVAIGAYMLFIRALSETDRRRKIGFGLLAIMCALNVMVVEGRTGYIVLAALMCYLFIEQFRWRGILLSLGLFVSVMLVAQQFPESPIMRRMNTGIHELEAWKAGQNEQTSIGLRMQYAAIGFHLIAERPLIGAGTGGYEVVYNEAAVLMGGTPSYNPHNQYLLTAVQLGLLGLTVLLVLFAVLWWLSGRLSRFECLLARGILVSYLVGNLFNSFLYDHSEARFFAWAIGLLFCGVAVRLRHSG